MTTLKVATHSGRNGSQRGENPLKSKVATGRNTLSIYYVYMRAAFGAAARIVQTTKIEFITLWLNGIAWCVTTRDGLVPRHVLFNGLGMMMCVSRHCPANHQFTRPLFILATAWWSTKQRVRFVVSRVVSFIGLNVVCSVNHLSLILTNDRWSQCPVIVRGDAHVVGGYAFALRSFGFFALSAGKRISHCQQNQCTGAVVSFDWVIFQPKNNNVLKLAGGHRGRITEKFALAGHGVFKHQKRLSCTHNKSKAYCLLEFALASALGEKCVSCFDALGVARTCEHQQTQKSPQHVKPHFSLCALSRCFIEPSVFYYFTSSNAAMALSNFGSVFFNPFCTDGQFSRLKATYSPSVEWAKTENLLPISSIVISAYSVSSKTCLGNQPNSVINPLVIARFGIGNCTNGESDSETSSAVIAKLSRCNFSSAKAPRKIDVCFANLAASSRCLAYRAFRTWVRITPPKPITPTIAVWNSFAKLNQSIRNPFGGTVQ